MGNSDMTPDGADTYNDGNFWWSIGYLGHIMPAIPLYIYGLLAIISYLREWTFSRRTEIIMASCEIFLGISYAAIELDMVFYAETNMQYMSSITHTNVGIAIALGGVLHLLYVLWGTKWHERIPNLGMPAIFIGVALALSFHDHMHSDGSEDVASNRAHLAFATGMILSGLSHMLIRRWKRWTIPFGCLVIYCSAMLTALSPFILEPVISHHVGVGNLTMYCIFFAMLHFFGAIGYEAYYATPQSEFRYQISQRDDMESDNDIMI